MCRVPIRCDTSRACYSFLICCVKVMLSLCFLSFPQSFLAVPHSSLTLLFSPLLFSFFLSLAEVSLMWQQQRKKMQKKDAKIQY